MLVDGAGFNPWLASALALPAGAAAGACTGILYTRFGINKLLAGILVAFALYSVNIMAIGAARAFPRTETVMSAFRDYDAALTRNLGYVLLVHPAQIAFWLIVFLVVKVGKRWHID